MNHLSLRGVLALASSLCLAAEDPLVLEMSALRPRDSLVVQRGSVVEDATWMGIQDSGTHLVFRRGGIQIPSYAAPRGPWYAVARLRMDAYGIDSSWYNSVVLSTATWPDHYTKPPIQGFQFRTGGSGLYPALPRDPKVSDAAYTKALGVLDREMQAKLSRCLLGFSQASTDPLVNWIMSNSDRCLPLGEWVHFAAGWDGVRQRIFLNGKEVTDTLRQLGKGLVPRQDPGVPLTIGIRGAKVLDEFQFFQGALQYARIHAGVLDSAKARALHEAGQPTLSGPCKAASSIVRPLVAAATYPLDTVVVALGPSTSCQAGMVADLVLHSGDSLDILAISLDESRRVLGIARVGSLSFPISVLGLPSGDATPFVLKTRLLRAKEFLTPLAGRAASTSAPHWDMERPMVLIGEASTVGPRSASSTATWISSRRLRLPEGAKPIAVRADGTCLRLPAPVEPGVWDLSSLPRGIWWIRFGESALVYRSL